MQYQLSHHATGITLNCQAVLFDLDGTLVQSTSLISDILRAWAIEQQLDPNQVIDYSHGKRTQDIVAHFIEDECPSIHYEALTQKFLEAAHQTQAIKGAIAFIQLLNARNIPWAIVSSSENALIHSRMSAAGFPKPQSVVSAEMIQQGKPHPEGYLLAAEMLQVSIQHCLIFEDSSAGILAAEAAGGQLIVVGHSQQSYLCIQDFTEFN